MDKYNSGLQDRSDNSTEHAELSLSRYYTHRRIFFKYSPPLPSFAPSKAYEKTFTKFGRRVKTVLSTLEKPTLIRIV